MARVKPYNKTDHARYLDDGGEIKDPEAITAVEKRRLQKRGGPLINAGNYLRDNHRAAFDRDLEIRKQNWADQKSRPSRLEDHEVAQLVNAVTAAVKPICKAQSLRFQVSQAITTYLGGLNS